MTRTLFLSLTFVTLCKVLLTQPQYCGDPNPPDVCPFPQNLTVKNVALKAAVAQSTTYAFGGEARLAVDGNRNQEFWVGKSCSHTSERRIKEETVPWLRVDLSKAHLVRSVTIYTRSDPCCADRYHDIQVRVGNHREGGLGRVFTKNGMCAEVVGGGYEAGSIFNFTCAPCLAGRYVSVQIVRNCDKCSLPDYNMLSICELEVYGYPVKY